MICTISWLDRISDGDMFKSVLLINLTKHAIDVNPHKDSNSSSFLVSTRNVVKLETFRSYLIHQAWCV